MTSPLNNKHQFKWLLLVLFLVMSIGIYFRELENNPHVPYLAVAFWQLMLWMPWVLIDNTIKQARIYFENKWFIYGLCLLLAGLHVLYFVFYSTFFSPYVGAINSKYGVYPYFFIFWSIIDVLLIWVVWSRSNHRSLTAPAFKQSKYIIKEGSKHVVLTTADISKITAEDYYVRVHSAQGEFLQRKSLKELIKQLPEHEFIRIHRSTIINLNHIKQVVTQSRKGTFVELLDGSMNKVSKSQNIALKTKLRHSLHN